MRKIKEKKGKEKKDDKKENMWSIQKLNIHKY